MARQTAGVRPGNPAPRREPRPTRNRGGASRRGGGRGSDRRRREEQSRVTEPLTPAGVRKETRASTNLKYRPTERKIGAELRTSKQRTRQVGDWWNTYLDQVDQGRAEVDAAYQRAAATQQGMIDTAGARDASATAALQEEANASAALRGAAPSTAPAEREAAAGAQRSYLSALQGGETASRGASEYAYLTDQKRIGRGQSIASRREEQRRSRGIESDRRDLARERGDYATTKRSEIRKEERDYLIQRRAFPQEKAELRQKEREAREDRRAGSRSQSETERHNRATEQNSREDNNEGGDNGPTRSERRDAREGRRSALSVAKRLIGAYGAPTSPKEWAELEEQVSKEEEVSPAEAHWAVKRIKSKRSSRPPRTPQGPTINPSA